MYLVILYLTLLTSGYFYPLLKGGDLLTERDLASFFIQPRILWVETIKNGEFSLWNPYYYSGHPLLATLQPAVFYPLNILLLILPFDLAFNWIIVLHFLLGGVFTLLLMRGLGTSLTGSLIGALTFMLSGYLLSVIWVPLVIYLYLKTIKEGSLNHAILVGITLTIMFMGGGVEVVYGTI